MLTERLLSLSGFIYEIGGNYYYMGKWICRPCTDTDATDSVAMYQMCRQGQEEPDTNMYFQKIRAHSDFALEVPYNPEKIRQDLSAIEEGLTEEEWISLETQIRHFEEDLSKYCG
ncbi:MAG TPA: hypothetical protein H9873_03065 [Candidatus Dorea gallistercoris]|uniref:Uncharacterized protein n=1 Tax=Candidatus Dorea gallistercoris TaxID=2838542 RepID=A0A9D1R7R0_9FIRM|nr:hypothetical protein [Candidatus Dorea gallistercoris]